MSVTKGQDSNIRAAKKGLNVRIGFLILWEVSGKLNFSYSPNLLEE